MAFAPGFLFQLQAEVGWARGALQCLAPLPVNSGHWCPADFTWLIRLGSQEVVADARSLSDFLQVLFPSLMSSQACSGCYFGQATAATLELNSWSRCCSLRYCADHLSCWLFRSWVDCRVVYRWVIFRPGSRWLWGYFSIWGFCSQKMSGTCTPIVSGSSYHR